MTIYFYKRTEEYGYMSNFAHYEFELDGKRWPTSEHYFQAGKFADEEYRNKIQQEKNPMKAAELGRSRAYPIREDWEEVKDEVMKQALLAKFQQNSEIRQQLLDTGKEELVEKTSTDYYWGCGTDGTGKNTLGKLLMEIRSILAEEKRLGM